MEYVSIEDLEFTVRTYNCLKRYGVNSLEELANMTEIDFQKVRNLGRLSRREIDDKLNEYGLVEGNE